MVPPFPPYQKLPPEHLDFNRIRAWITHCETYHPEQCSSMPRTHVDDAYSLHGFRFIDCVSKQSIPVSRGVRYVALSYVWGESASRGSHDHGFDSNHESNKYPRTIQDAMTVTLSLGFRYLWVDKFCIDQTNSKDLHEQISRMDEIYQNATLTIIAADGSDADYGLPGVRPASRHPLPRLMINKIGWLSVPWNIHDPLSLCPWNSRAWTYQEGYFSRRRLIFATEYIIFQCNTACCSELSHLDTKVALESGEYRRASPNPESLFDSTSTIIPMPQKNLSPLQQIEGYTERKLSHQSDVLNAIQGFFSSLATSHPPAAEHGADVGKFRHLWGIPTVLQIYVDHFLRYDWINLRQLIELCAIMTRDQELYAAIGFGLGWILDGHGGRPREGFPSWSWAGWIGSVWWKTFMYSHFEEADLPAWLGIQTTNHQDEPLDIRLIDIIHEAQKHEQSLYTYRLIIETTIVEVQLLHDTGNGFHFSATTNHPGRLLDSRGGYLDMLIWQAEMTLNVWEESDLWIQLCTQKVECAVMFGHYGLLVRSEHGVAERIGVIESLDTEVGARSKSSQEDVLDFRYIKRREPGHQDDLCLKNCLPTRKGRLVLG